MTFYDENKNPIDVSSPIIIGEQFAIARLPQRPGENIVGLFSEDDDAYFLVADFSAYWLLDLADVALKASK